MTYSDKDLQIATEIAYFDLDLAFRNRRGFSNGDFNVVDVIITYIEKRRGKLSDGDIERLNHIIEYLKDPQKNWKIIDYKNDNRENQSGFYGIVIDTGDGLIVSFRGCEDITDPQHVKQD